MEQLEERDLAELLGQSLYSVYVSKSSLKLVFENGASVLLQCPFSVLEAAQTQAGNGESPETALLLIPFFNETVQSVRFGESHELTLAFEGNRTLTVMPESDGFESYVVSTKHGICPVIGT